MKFQPSLDEIRLDAIIENWVRWARGRLTKQRSRVGSLEGNYSTMDWGEDVVEPEPVKTRLNPIDELLAMRTEEAWKRLPRKLGQILKFEYIVRQHYKATCRRIHIPFNSYAQRLMDARNLLLEGLDR